jgi:hypothetical protein
MGKYYLQVLQYLSNENIVNRYSIKINGINDEELQTTINDLEKDDLLSIQIGGIAINEDGKDYLIKHKYNL